MMGKISANIIVTSAEKRVKAKKLQQSNREWVSIIQTICANDWALPPVIIVAGQYHFSIWY
jgi:hypothetical protein